MMHGRHLGVLASSLVVAAVLSGCSDDPQSKSRYNVGGPNGSSGSAGSSGGASSGGVAAITCPGDVAAPASLATDVDATDIHVIGDFVYFRSETKIVRIKKDGSARTDVYTSKDLIRSFTDGTTFVSVESPNPPNAVIKVGPLGEKPTAQTNTNQNAASIEVFGATADGAYAIADQDNGDVIYRIGKGGDNGGGFDQIAETNGVVSDAQVVGGAIWYVKDLKDVYKMTPPGEGVEGAEPALVFTAEKGCTLTVGTTHLFCSVEGSIEQRDLTGANPKTLFTEKTSKVPVAFGAGQASGDTVVVRSATNGNNALKDVLRTINAAGEEKVVACGRDQISAVAVDGASVAWIEKGKGVFIVR